MKNENATYVNPNIVSTLDDLGKLNSMLLNFASGKHFNRFDAEVVGDHCLPSTISDLQKRDGLTFSRKWEKVPNRFGTFTKVMRYWLEGDSLIRARQLMGLEEKT